MVDADNIPEEDVSKDVLSEEEKMIIMADTIYDTAHEKLFYVHRKKGLLLPNGELDPLKKKQAMSVPTFYRKLRKIKEKTKTRMYEIAKNFQSDTLDQHELLKKIEKDKLQIMELSRSKKDYSAVNRIGDSIIAMQPYLASIKECIKDIMENDLGGSFKTSVASTEEPDTRTKEKRGRVLSTTSRERTSSTSRA